MSKILPTKKMFLSQTCFLNTQRPVLTFIQNRCATRSKKIRKSKPWKSWTFPPNVLLNTWKAVLTTWPKVPPQTSEMCWTFKNFSRFMVLLGKLLLTQRMQFWKPSRNLFSQIHEKDIYLYFCTNKNFPQNVSKDSWNAVLTTLTSDFCENCKVFFSVRQ